MTIIKSVIYANFEEPRSRDRDLGTLKLRKSYHFCLENLLIRLQLQNGLTGMLKFEYNLGADRDRNFQSRQT